MIVSKNSAFAGFLFTKKDSLKYYIFTYNKRVLKNE